MYKKLLKIATKSKNYLNDEACSSILNFIKSMQFKDNGFIGRTNSGSDLYYSMFATLAYLTITGTTPQGMSSYLKSLSNSENLDFIHLCALARLYACSNIETNIVKQEINSNIEAYRSMDGGYNHIEKCADRSTPYGIFLAYSAYQELKIIKHNNSQLLNALLDCQTPDMGFSNTPGQTIGTTNATAAALVMLNEFRDEGSKKVIFGAVDFLFSMKFPKGGFKAAKNAPLPDILSTATSLFALNQLEIPISNQLKTETLALIEDHWDSSGGFFGNQGDTLPDCEYTFYAMLALGAI